MRFLVRLKPLTPFFFGTDKTFSDETIHDVVSSYFPQQTHLLGMVRNYILQTNNLLSLRDRGRWVKTANFKKAFEFVGGFDKNNPSKTEESFGKVETLSPVFILSTKDEKIEDFHFVAPKDVGLNIEVDSSNQIYIAGKKRDKVYKIANYDPKVGLTNALTTSKFWKNYRENKISLREYDKKLDYEKLGLLSFEKVFIEVKQVGIKRDKISKSIKEDDEGSFYHKTSYSFAGNFEFAFFIDVKEDIFPKKEGFVYLGAERSTFSIKIEKFNDNLVPDTKVADNKFVALSDVEIGNFDDIEFMVNSDYIPHAYMKRGIKKEHRASGKHSKLEQRCYIPRGSVLFLKDNRTLSFTQIGYNQIIKEIK